MSVCGLEKSCTVRAETHTPTHTPTQHMHAHLPRVVGDENHIAENVAKSAGDYPWAYNLIGALVLDYCNLTGRYGMVTVEKEERVYFVFSIPKVYSIIQMYYCKMKQCKMDECTPVELEVFFLDTFFANRKVPGGGKNVRSAEYTPQGWRKEIMGLLEPVEKVKILAAMGMKWDFSTSTCDVFEKSTIVMPVSWVSVFVSSMQGVLSEEDERMKLQKQFYGVLKYAGLKRALGGVYPPAAEHALIREMCFWDRSTGFVENNTNSKLRTRKSHLSLSVEYSNYPVSELFILKYAGRAMACAIARLCVDFNGEDAAGVKVDLPVLVDRSPACYISCCQSKYYKSSVHFPSKSWAMDDCVKHCQKQSLLLKWIKEEIGDIPIEMRAERNISDSDSD